MTSRNFTKNDRVLATTLKELMTIDLRYLFEENLKRSPDNLPVFYPQEMLFSMYNLDFLNSENSLCLTDVFKDLSEYIGKSGEEDANRIVSKSMKIMILLSELGVRYTQAVRSQVMFIEDIYYTMTINNLFGFLSKITGYKYDDITEQIVEFIDDSNRLSIGPDIDIDNITIGDVLLKSNLVFKLSALAKDLYTDNRERCEELRVLRTDAGRAVSNILFLPYETCFEMFGEEYEEILLTDYDDFEDDVIEKHDQKIYYKMYYNNKGKTTMNDKKILMSILGLTDTPAEKLHEKTQIDYNNFYSDISERKISTAKDIILSLSELYEDIEKGIKSPEEDKYTSPTIYAFANHLNNPCNKEPMIMSLSVEDLTGFYEKYCPEDSDYTTGEYISDHLKKYYELSGKEQVPETIRIKDLISFYLNLVDKEYMASEIEGNDLSVAEEKEKELTLVLMKLLISNISNMYDPNGNLIQIISEIMKGEN